MKRIIVILFVILGGTAAGQKNLETKLLGKWICYKVSDPDYNHNLDLSITFWSNGQMEYFFPGDYSQYVGFWKTNAKGTLYYLSNNAPGTVPIDSLKVLKVNKNELVTQWVGRDYKTYYKKAASYEQKSIHVETHDFKDAHLLTAREWMLYRTSYIKGESEKDVDMELEFFTFNNDHTGKTKSVGENYPLTWRIFDNGNRMVLQRKIDDEVSSWVCEIEFLNKKEMVLRVVSIITDDTEVVFQEDESIVFYFN